MYNADLEIGQAADSESQAASESESESSSESDPGSPGPARGHQVVLSGNHTLALPKNVTSCKCLLLVREHFFLCDGCVHMQCNFKKHITPLRVETYAMIRMWLACGSRLVQWAPILPSTSLQTAPTRRPASLLP